MAEEPQGRNADHSASHGTPVPYQPPRDLLDAALRQVVGPDVPGDIMHEAQRERLRLDVKRAEGHLDSVSAEKDMGYFLEEAKAAERANMNYEADAEFRFASGKAYVRVTTKKSFDAPAWLGWVVALLLLAGVLLVVLARV